MRTVVFVVGLAALMGCSSDRRQEAPAETYRREVRELGSTTVTRKRSLLFHVEEHWRAKRAMPFDAPFRGYYGAGALPVPEEEHELLQTLRDLLDDDPRVVEAAANVLGVIRASGSDEKLLDCAVQSAAYQACIDALMHVADPKTLDEMVRLMNLDAPIFRGEENHRNRMLNKRSSGRDFAIAMSYLGTRGIPYLEKAVRHGDRDGCHHGLGGLELLLDAKTPDRDPPILADKTPALDAVKHGLTREHWRCRRRSGTILLEHDRASRSLVEPLRRDPVPAVRDVISAALDGKPLPDYEDYDDAGMPVRKPKK